LVGLAQVVAGVFPGTSRSAAAIFIAMLAGLSQRSAAAEFVFLVGIPTMFAASGYALFELWREQGLGSEQWDEVALAFAAASVRSGLAVTSGLAAGIDGAAHRTALDAGGLTVAVLGTGIDIPYPARHADLHREIERHGVLVSEYPPGTPPRRGHFPARNRIIAGLALGTLVIEAALRSGALITARLAAESGREVFAIPGSIHNPMARGCHRLIRQGAALVEDAGEIIESLAPLAAQLGQHLHERLHADSAAVAMPAATPAQEPVHAEARRIWQALGHDPVTLEHLAQRTRLTVATLSSALLMLELDGWITSAHGRYARKSK